MKKRIVWLKSTNKKACSWEVIEGVVSSDPPGPISTKGGGSGIVVIYGVAAPVKTPVIGQMRRP